MKLLELQNIVAANLGCCCNFEALLPQLQEFVAATLEPCCCNSRTLFPQLWNYVVATLGHCHNSRVTTHCRNSGITTPYCNSGVFTTLYYNSSVVTLVLQLFCRYNYFAATLEIVSQHGNREPLKLVVATLRTMSQHSKS